MRLLLPEHVIATLQRELKRARYREIGGVLVGERLDSDLFRLVDLSVQRSGGSRYAFSRQPDQHRAFLTDFFARTGYDYERFNYLGEWHSHPGIPPLPSNTDLASMQEIACDVAVNAPFAVLMIVRRMSLGGLELSATEFRCDHAPVGVGIHLESSGRSRHRIVNGEKTMAVIGIPSLTPNERQQEVM